MASIIPHGLLGVAARVLSGWYTHSQLDSLFYTANFPGDPPAGNKVDKCLNWMRIANQLSDDPLKLFGNLIAEFMETDPSATAWWINEETKSPDPREPLLKALASNGLHYDKGGRIVGASVSVPTRSLGQRLAEEGIEALDIEYQRSYNSVQTDPPSAVTAACAILESLFKTYLEEEGEALPAKQTLSLLWQAVSKKLGMRPGEVADDDLKRILSGLNSIIDGIGALRTHEGSAHGRSEEQRKNYRIEARHARLAVHSSHTVALFVLETWKRR